VKNGEERGGGGRVDGVKNRSEKWEGPAGGGGSNIIFFNVSLPPQERKESVCVLKIMALKVAFESSEIYVII